MHDAYIFLGSNIARERNYPEAVRRLCSLGRLVAVSPVYVTPALDAEGNPATDAPDFYNGAVWLETKLSPHALHNALRAIERDMGRMRTADKFAPRPIDLDLVLYGEVTLNDQVLTLPDPYLFERGFMAHALAQLNPDYVIPPDGPTLAELASRLRHQAGALVQAPDITRQVQEYITSRLEVTNHMSESNLINLLAQPRSSLYSGNGASRPGCPDEPPEQREARHLVIADAVRSILENVGEDPSREGLLKTPERVARAYDELLAGYTVDPVALVNDALFETQYDDMVVVKDIEFYSLCEHHLLPFYGVAHVAYIPDGKVIGLSKIPRIVEMYARRLQLQENMTRQIADFLQEVLNPRGIAVVVTGQHMCAMMRGVNKTHSKMITQIHTGAFQDHGIRAQLNDHLCLSTS